MFLTVEYLIEYREDVNSGPSKDWGPWACAPRALSVQTSLIGVLE